MAMYPVGQLSNYKVLNQVQTGIQKADREQEQQRVALQNAPHTNPGIPDPGAVLQRNVDGIKGPLGTKLDLQTKLGTKNNQLNLLA